MSNTKNGVIYIGVTSDLVKRVYEHKEGMTEGFTKKYNAKLLVYFAVYDSMQEAIIAEKKLKNRGRNRKIELIESINPKWDDLYETLF